MANLPNPSPETYELVHELYETRDHRGDANSLREWLRLLARRMGADRADMRTKRCTALVRQIAAREEPAILPYLLCALFDEPAVVRATIEAVQQLVCAVPTNQLPALSEEMRRPWWDWGDYRDWNALEPAHLLRFAELGEPKAPFWGLLSFHSNGYVREAALGWLDRFDSGEEIPFLLMRATDWVPQVRRRACELLESRLTSRFAPTFTEHLELVVRLESSERADTDELLAAIHTMLRSDQGSDVLLEQLESESHTVARAALEIAVTTEAPATDPAIRRALEQNDVVLRTRAIEAARQHLDGEKLAALITRHRNDPHRMVRQGVIETFVAKFPERAGQVLWKAIFDKSRSIRQYARFYLDRMGEDDFLSAYRQSARSEDRRHLRAGLRGLGDIGEAQDAELVAHHLTDASSKTRRIALRALGEIDPTEYLDSFVDALQDDIGSNSRAAAAVLSEHLYTISRHRLLEIYIDDPRPHVRQNIRRLFNELGYWDRIEFLLRAATADDTPEEVEQIDVHLRKWIGDANRVFTSPSATRVESIEEALLLAEERLPQRTVAEIRRVLELKGARS